MGQTPLQSEVRPKRWTRWCLTILIAPWLAVGGFALYLIAVHNFHVVSPGVFYRSAQMGGTALAHAVKEYGIKTVLNLRGPGAGQDWYTSEMTAAQQLGIQHFDFSLSATRELKDEEMDSILDLIARAPKPILIHCKSGSDRTGLVGALYLYGIEGQSAAAAGRQLNALYGHLPHLFWGNTAAMDNSFWRYVRRHSQSGEAAVKPAKSVEPAGGTTLSMVHEPAQ